MDAVRHDQQRDYGTDAAPLVRDPSVIRVHNMTGEDLPRLAIAGLNEPVFSPFDEEATDEYNNSAESTLINEPSFTITWPPDNSHRGRFVVLLEPIPNNGTGEARMSDLQLVVVEDTVLVGQFVDVKQDARPRENVLSRVPGGSAKVLWTGPKRSSITISEAIAGSGSNNETQTITLGNYSGGTFTLTFDDTGSNPQTTADIAFDASSSEIKAALEALSNINTVDVTGGPLPLMPVSVEFQGTNALTNVPLMTSTSNLTGAPKWALVRLCSDEIEIIQGLVVDDFEAADGPLTGGVCYSVRPIVDSGTKADSLSCANDFETLVLHINRQRAETGDDLLDDDYYDVDAVNRSTSATAQSGTLVKVDSSSGEFGDIWIDCGPSDEGLAALVPGAGGSALFGGAGSFGGGSFGGGGFGG